MASAVDSAIHHVHLIVFGPGVVDERPEFLEYVCAQGEGTRHTEEEVPDLPDVWSWRLAMIGDVGSALLSVCRSLRQSKHASLRVPKLM